MRGLKQDKEVDKQTEEDVASFTDAWIETLRCRNQSTNHRSHLLQMRGLKLF